MSVFLPTQKIKRVSSKRKSTDQLLGLFCMFSADVFNARISNRTATHKLLTLTSKGGEFRILGQSIVCFAKFSRARGSGISY